MADLPAFYYASPNAGYGRAANELAKAFFSGPSAFEQDYLRARASAATARAERDRAETANLVAKGQAGARLSDVFNRMSMTEAPRPTPEFVGPMPVASPDQYFNANRGAIVQSAVDSGATNPGAIARMVAGMMGASPNRMADVYLGAGGDYAHTQPGFDAEQTNKRDTAIAVQNAANQGAISKVFATPVQTTAGSTTTFAPGDPRAAGGPVQGRDTESTAKAALLKAMTPDDQRVAVLGQPAYGANESQVKGSVLAAVRPDLSEDETKRVVGALPAGQPTPRNYLRPDGLQGTTLDGVTDAATNEPLPQGTQIYTNQANSTPASVQADRMKASDARKRLSALIEHTKKLAGDEANFGLPGFVKGTLQDAGQLLSGLSNMFGYKSPENAFESIRKRALQDGVSPDLLNTMFDPTLPKLHSAANLLTFVAAEALAGQSGRGVSDRDVLMMKDTVGDPTTLFGSKKTFISKLKGVEEMIAVLDKAAGPGAASQKPAAVASDPLSKARDAISRGADPEAVKQRLRQHGIDPARL